MLGSGKWKFCFSELSGIFFLKYFWSQLSECMKANCVIWFHLYEAIENTNLIYKNRKLFTCVWGYRIKKGQRLVNLGRWKCYVILIVQRLIRCMDLLSSRTLEIHANYILIKMVTIFCLYQPDMNTQNTGHFPAPKSDHCA